MISQFFFVKSYYFFIFNILIMINDFYCVKFMIFDRIKELLMFDCFYSIGNLLYYWKVYCQWFLDIYVIDLDSDELIDSFVEVNDIFLERVVSF